MDLKKIALSLLAFGVSSAASAGGFMPAPEHSGWDVGLTGYWGRMTSEHMEQNTLTNPLSSISPIGYIFVKPDYRFGFAVEGSFHWGKGNDLVLEWTHFNKSFETRQIINTTNLSGNAGDLGIATAKFKFDTLNLELGQQSTVGSNWDTRIHLGLQQLKINRTLGYAQESVANINAGTFIDFVETSRFTGIGPRVGIDGAYHLTDNWSLIGDVAASIIAGKIRGDAVSRAFTTFQLTSSLPTDQGTNYTMVGGLDGRVGIQYDRSLGTGMMNLSTGYAGAIYMNPILGATPLYSSNVTSTERTRSNFGVGSFFVTAKYQS